MTTPNTNFDHAHVENVNAHARVGLSHHHNLFDKIHWLEDGLSKQKVGGSNISAALSPVSVVNVHIRALLYLNIM
jgi:hypothetical protein